MKKIFWYSLLAGIVISGGVLVHAAQEDPAHAAQEVFLPASAAQEADAQQQAREAQENEDMFVRAILDWWRPKTMRYRVPRRVGKHNIIWDVYAIDLPWDPNFKYDIAKIEQLLRARVNPNTRMCGSTALREALVDNGLSSGVLAQLLVHYGADYRLMGEKNNKILEWALSKDQDFETKKMKMEALMEGGMRLNGLDSIKVLILLYDDKWYWSPPQTLYSQLSDENKGLVLLIRDRGSLGWTDLLEVLPELDVVSLVAQYAKLDNHEYLAFAHAQQMDQETFQQVPFAASEDQEGLEGEQESEDDGREPALKKRKKEARDRESLSFGAYAGEQQDGTVLQNGAGDYDLDWHTGVCADGDLLG